MISTVASLKEKDITITLTYEGNAYTIDFQVFTPSQLALIHSEDNELRSGYQSIIVYSVKDQFGDQLPHKVPANEDIDGDGKYSNANKVSKAAISVWTKANGKPNDEDWDWNAEDSDTVSPDGLADKIERINANLTPNPLWPNITGANAEIDHSPNGAIYVGSLVSGKGVKVKNITWTIFRGFARHK